MRGGRWMGRRSRGIRGCWRVGGRGVFLTSGSCRRVVGEGEEGRGGGMRGLTK